MKLEAIPKTFLGQRDKQKPYKVMNPTRANDAIAEGETAAQAIANAMNVILDAYNYSIASPHMAKLADGSVFVARQTGANSYELWRFSGTRSYPSSEMGYLNGRTLADYFAFAVADYERVTAA